MNEYLIQQHQESIQHQVRVAHLEQFVLEQWLQKFFNHSRKPINHVPLALNSADAACICLF